MITSLPLILLACFCVGGGRIMVRRSRRAERGKWRKRTIGWLLMVFGLVLMTFGVLMW